MYDGYIGGCRYGREYPFILRTIPCWGTCYSWSFEYRDTRSTNSGDDITRSERVTSTCWRTWREDSSPYLSTFDNERGDLFIWFCTYSRDIE